jgi:hypothetical protein
MIYGAEYSHRFLPQLGIFHPDPLLRESNVRILPVGHTALLSQYIWEAEYS